ncbi:MAG: ribosome recycling factor [Clostridia bacterium]
MQDKEMIDEILMGFDASIEKATAFLKNEYLIIRAGRANSHILDKVFAEYYGVLTPINQMCNISTPEARQLVINVWDQSQLKNVYKAISEANLGVSISEDGKMIRLTFPILTEDRRRDLVKNIKKLAEDAKISLRNARRECLEFFKQMKKDGEISEDEQTSLEKDVQKSLDVATASIDAMSQNKEKEIMEI